MYLKDEWNVNNAQLQYDGDYEKLPYMYCDSMEKCIRKLFSLDKEQTDQAKRIIEKCEFTIELMQNEMGAIDENLIEYYQILILAYKLFRFDEGDNSLSVHVLQLRLIACCEEFLRYEDFEHTLFLLDDLIPDFESEFYMGEFEWISRLFYEFKILVKCRKYIKEYKYEAAYENYITLINASTSKKAHNFEGADYERRLHVYWVKKHFINLLRVAQIAGKLSDVKRETNIIFDKTYSLLDKSEKKEFSLLLEREQSFNKSDKITLKLVDIFESEYRKNKENKVISNSRFELLMDFLIELSETCSYEEEYLKLVLRKIIEVGVEEPKRKNFFTRKNYTELLIIAIFRLLSLVNEEEWIDNEIIKSVWDEVTDNNIGKAFLVEPLFRWGIVENQDNDKIREVMRSLSSLYNKVLEFESYIKVKNYQDEKIAYYTTMQTLGYLLMDEDKLGVEKCRLSVMNVGYMNDPNEGKVINEVLEKNITSNTSEFYQFIDVNDKRVPKKADKTLIFLKSFSDKVDRLTMWSEYGDKGNGACIVLNGETFQNAKARINLLRELDVPISSNDYDDFDLYKVIYWNKNDNGFWANGLNSRKLNQKMNDIFEALQVIFDTLSVSTFTDHDKRRIMIFLETLFSRLKYLIKFEEYKDENETRLIFQRKTVNSFKDIEEVPGEVLLKKKLYIHYPVQTMIKEIILGPKNLESDEYIPFLLKRMAEINEPGGHNTDICKSAIDYR